MQTAECAATPAEELERQIMSPSVPKNEREHWAAREIERLRARLSAKMEPDYFYDPEDWEVTIEWSSRFDLDEVEVELGKWKEYATVIHSCDADTPSFRWGRKRRPFLSGVDTKREHLY